MVESAPNRRQLLASGLAIALSPFATSGVLGAGFEGNIFPRPLAGSRTVSSFASGLFFCEDAMPLALSRAIEAELARTDVAPDSVKDERQRAEFFARLTVRRIAPRALRRAGYDQLATDVSNGVLAPAAAQHTIGKQYAYSHPMPRLASFAYGASAHASTAAFYVSHEDINVVVETGNYSARALLEPFSYEDADAAEAAWIWDFAVTAINMATGIDSDDAANLDAAAAPSTPSSPKR